MRGCSAIFACSSPPPLGASATTGSARPTPKPSPIARPSCGSPSAIAIPASAHTAKLRMNVVKPSPSSTPYRPAASGTGMTRRQDSGTWRRTWGMIRAPFASPAAAASATSAASDGRAGAERVAQLRQAAERDHAAHQRAGANVMQATTVVLSRPAYPAGASVSTIENPHGDHAPVTPATSAVPRPPPSAERRPRVSSLLSHFFRVVVHDAEDLPAVVAVARQGLVAVDAVVDGAAAVGELADVAAAAAVPGAVDVRREAVLGRGDAADLGARRLGQRARRRRR